MYKTSCFHKKHSHEKHNVTLEKMQYNTWTAWLSQQAHTHTYTHTHAHTHTWKKKRNTTAYHTDFAKILSWLTATLYTTTISRIWTGSYFLNNDLLAMSYGALCPDLLAMSYGALCPDLLAMSYGALCPDLLAMSYGALCPDLLALSYGALCPDLLALPYGALCPDLLAMSYGALCPDLLAMSYCALCPDLLALSYGALCPDLLALSWCTLFWPTCHVIWCTLFWPTCLVIWCTLFWPTCLVIWCTLFWPTCLVMWCILFYAKNHHSIFTWKELCLWSVAKTLVLFLIHVPFPVPALKSWQLQSRNTSISMLCLFVSLKTFKASLHTNKQTKNPIKVVLSFSSLPNRCSILFSKTVI